MDLVWEAPTYSSCLVPSLATWPKLGRHLWCEQATMEALLSSGFPGGHSLRLQPLLIGKAPKTFLTKCPGEQERSQAW